MGGLFNSTVLDVAIGLVFVYLLLALLCTAANEWIAGLLKSRAKMLKKSIEQLLDNQPTLTDKEGTTAFLGEFYRHPLITGLMRDGTNPSYIPARIFTAVVTDLMTVSNAGTITFSSLEDGLRSMPEGDVKRALSVLVQRSNQDLEVAQQAIEGWFNDAMDRVTGWYKRRTQVVTLFVALFLTLLANADSIHIARRLWTDPVLRAAVVEEAKNRAQKPRPSVSVEYLDENDPTKPTVTRNEGNTLSDQERALLGQLLGWRGSLKDNTGQDWFERVFGWLLTVLALSLGAPFWFDLLNKFVNIRSNGKSPDETAKTPAKHETTVRA
jgi:hypothetical protein